MLQDHKVGTGIFYLGEELMKHHPVINFACKINENNEIIYEKLSKEWSSSLGTHFPKKESELKKFNINPGLWFSSSQEWPQDLIINQILLPNLNTYSIFCRNLFPRYQRRTEKEQLLKEIKPVKRKRNQMNNNVSTSTFSPILFSNDQSVLNADISFQNSSVFSSFPPFPPVCISPSFLSSTFSCSDYDFPKTKFQKN